MTDIIILIVALICSSLILLLAIKNKPYPGSVSLIIFALTVLLAAALNYYIDQVPAKTALIGIAITYFSIRIAFTTVLTFVLETTHQDAWLRSPRILLLAIEPLIMQFLFWANPGGVLSNFKTAIVVFDLVPTDSLWFLINTFYTNSLLLIALSLLVWDFSYRSLAYRQRTWIILIGIAISLLANNNFSTQNFLPIHELKIVALLISGISFIGGFYYNRVYSVTQIARDSVVEHMKDGWIVLDTDNRIVDLNSAAEKIIGISGKQLAGQPAEKIFIDWPNLKNSLTDTRELDVKGSVKIDDDWIYLNIHISPLYDADSNLFGKLIVWRDITGQRLVDEARQQARDEMFILLHSITSAASRAINLDDFLSESIYQIVFSSHSQAIAVYVLEEYEKDVPERHLVLAAQHGIPISPDSQMAIIPETLEAVRWVLDHAEPLQILETQTDPRIPPAMQAMGSMTMLIIPMMLESQALGIIGLTRPAGSPYSQDEIVRLSAVADEVATFIQSNRQRQLSIALAERQRLVRDLHDSVTQKLYGLVITAEATQAKIQAGIEDEPNKVIGKMAEIARQALKEMRLFLFQMQPVDFERDGLVVALRQRLAAVENRADMNVRLTADENFHLPLEKQLALYFIAQEALNNILKHARAKNVNIWLKNRRSNITLEIDDDGCGFDPKMSDSGGMGMRSMRERAVQMGGKLKIASAPGSGTKIFVTLKKSGVIGG